MIDWLRRRVLLLGGAQHGSLHLGDWCEFWWRPRKGGGQIRGLRLCFDPFFMEGFVIALSRYQAHFSWTDHNTYVREWLIWRSANYQRLLDEVAHDARRV